MTQFYESSCHLLQTFLFFKRKHFKINFRFHCSIFISICVRSPFISTFLISCNLILLSPKLETVTNEKSFPPSSFSLLFSPFLISWKCHLHFRWLKLLVVLSAPTWLRQSNHRLMRRRLGHCLSGPFLNLWLCWCWYWSVPNLLCFPMEFSSQGCFLSCIAGDIV